MRVLPHDLAVDLFNKIGTLAVFSIFPVVLVTGCETVTPQPCIPQIKEIPGPPKTIYVVMPRPKIGAEPTPESLDWTREQIAADPPGYIEALHSDLVEVFGLWAVEHFELRKLDAAVAAAILEGAVEGLPDE